MSDGDVGAVNAPNTARTAALFWWLTIGSFLSGLSLLSLIVSLERIGLRGLVATVHDQYILVRDILFDVIERVVALRPLSSETRSAITALVVLLAVGTRTYMLVQQRSSAAKQSTFLNVVGGAFFAFILVDCLFVAFVIPVVATDLEWYVRRNMFIMGVVLALIMAALLRGNPVVFLASLVYAINFVACVAVAGILLALGGAL